MFDPIRWDALVLGFALAAGCAGVSEGRTTCEPMETVEHAVLRGELLAAGERADGTIFMVDEDPTEEDYADYRVFRTTEGRFVQLDVGGWGEGGDMYMFEIYDGEEGPFSLVIESVDGEMRMSIHPSTDPGLNPEPSRGEGEALTPLSEGDVADVEFAPNVETPELWMAGETNDGNVLVITCDPDWGCPYEGRLFYGEPSELFEYPITDYGGSCAESMVWFDIDGVPGVLTLPNDGAPSLTVDGKSVGFEERSDLDPGYAFYCDPAGAEAASPKIAVPRCG
jgi:hypothetical protein